MYARVAVSVTCPIKTVLEDHTPNRTVHFKQNLLFVTQDDMYFAFYFLFAYNAQQVFAYYFLILHISCI